MKIFKIPVTYEMYGTIEVEAETIEQAIEYAKENIDELPLPEESHYIDASYEIEEDLDMIQFMNKEE